MKLPTTDITVFGSREEARISAIIDTGFDGYLMPPTSVAVPLGLELFNEGKTELADGTQQKQLVFLGTVEFLDEVQPVMIYLTDSEDALIGTQLLANCELKIDFSRNKVELKRIHTAQAEEDEDTPPC